ncbi:IclR family transcriptional regulator [Micromonospora sp. Llam0]|uniref:IclR family transcriptional regulator n=1 Tax=Micromonospora sp. Llam0 TaxID=2485143 RepID=UPI000F49FD13|nr:IclR family transcriptional regulator [Micromonospora sp. Llam0]ROO60594.1 IclR family transcriptional regulator [Micromonospora sp. Llam0]
MEALPTATATGFLFESESAAPDNNSVLRKVQRILEAFGFEDETLSLSGLARRTGLAKASVYRLSQELVHWGLLERSNGEYRLGMRLFEIGQRVPRQRILRDLARPLMVDLVQATNETVHLAVVDGLEVLYLDKVSGQNSRISSPSRVAGRMPLHCTATGKALLAFGPRALLEEVMAAPLARVTPRTTVAPGLLAGELRRARELGYAAEFEQARLGYMSVAIPLAGATGTTVAALAVTAPTVRAKPDRFAGLLSLVGRRITKLLSAQQI